MKRMGYSLWMAWQYRQTLNTYCRDPSLQCKSVLDLDPAILMQQGYKAIILDFDGVLASHGEEKLSLVIAHWLKNFIRVWPQDMIFILSNKPNLLRAHYFAQYFKGIKFIFPLHKKPYPD